jgi:hypothetical protein
MAIQDIKWREIKAVTAIAILMMCTTACTEKTITYYSENAGERIDRVLACGDGASDPNSLDCRNANAAQAMDKMLVTQNADELALSHFMGRETGIAKDPERRAYQVLELNSRNTRGVNCISLNSGKPSPTPPWANVYKVALAEKLIEPVAGKADVYQATPRGVEFLASQGDVVRNGYFCPVGFTYGPDPRLLEQQDLSEQYKGKEIRPGLKLSKLRLQKIAFNLTNTGSSQWFLRKLYPETPLPMNGKSVAQYVTVEFEGRQGESFAGAVYEVDGKVVGGKTLREVLAVYK